jgi:hypothetical protein
MCWLALYLYLVGAFTAGILAPEEAREKGPLLWVFVVILWPISFLLTSIIYIWSDGKLGK